MSHSQELVWFSAATWTAAPWRPEQMENRSNSEISVFQMWSWRTPQEAHLELRHLQHDLRHSTPVHLLTVDGWWCFADVYKLSLSITVGSLVRRTFTPFGILVCGWSRRFQQLCFGKRMSHRIFASGMAGSSGLFACAKNEENPKRGLSRWSTITDIQSGTTVRSVHALISSQFRSVLKLELIIQFVIRTRWS